MIKNKTKFKKSGFTLIEILLVITLIGIVASLLAPRIMGGFFSGQRKALKIQIAQLREPLELYRLDCGRYPTSEQGLKALMEKPSGGTPCPNYNPSAYYGKKKAPMDSWGKEFTYESDGSKFTIKSLGADGVEGGDGDNADLSSEDD